MADDYEDLDRREHEWDEDLELGDLGEDTRQAYHNAFSARAYLNDISGRLDRYSQAAPEERAKIEDDLHTQLYELHDNLTAADEILVEDPDRELSEDDAVAFGFLVPYQNETKDRLSELGEKIQEETSKELNSENISPVLRGNYEETIDYIHELEAELGEELDEMGEIEEKISEVDEIKDMKSHYIESRLRNLDSRI